MAAGEDASERLKYKTWVLKVSIHCEGCKKKVKRVLQNIEGVYTVDIEAPQNRVTVIGNVDGDTLVKKLVKSGKNAELVAEKKPSPAGNDHDNPNHKGNAKGKNKKKSGGDGNPNEPADDKKPSPSLTTTEEASTKPAAGTPAKGAVEKPGDQHTEKTPLPQDKPAVTATALGEQGGGSESGKKKKKKKKKGNKPAAADGGDGVSGNEAESEGEEKVAPAALSQAHHVPVYSYNTQPVYAYNMAYPSTSYDSTYYVPPPAAATHGYVYSSAADYSPPGIYYGDEPPSPRQPHSSYEMFSEENANACKVM